MVYRIFYREGCALNREAETSLTVPSKVEIDLTSSCLLTGFVYKRNRFLKGTVPAVILPLPFVNDLKHLGNVLQSDNSMTIDCNKKRAIFISKIHSLNQEFYFNSPDVILKLYNIYCCSFYGSSIWDLSSQCVSNCVQHGILLLEFFLMYLEIRIGT